jgi:hypothetical protein
MKDVAVDACCLINVLAAGNILPAPPRSAVRRKAEKPKRASHALEPTLDVPAVVAHETFYLLQPDEDEPQKLVKTPVDLGPYFRSGVLMECDMEGEEETDSFVQFAARLDDGEAACLAIAKSRGWALATDDRPAANLAGRVGVPVVTTAQLVAQWAKTAKADKARIASTLVNIQTFAKFAPPPSSPGAAWWYAHARKK